MTPFRLVAVPGLGVSVAVARRTLDRLPGVDGVQATIALREACPEVAVVCLTASANLREMEALKQAGAVACLTKDRELDEIVAAIRAAATR